MHRFSTPDEVFGPISISKLKNEDKLERSIEHYLPGTNVAFLDEIWKAGPSIQNTLLTILNEKIFRNGEQQINVDLFGIVAASNELPEENQGLEALWDRFLIRYHISSIENRENFEGMILNTENMYSDNVPDTHKISKVEYGKLQNQRDSVKIETEILDLIHHIRIKINECNKELKENEKQIYISDRRWKKIIKVLRTSAFLNFRKKVDLMDCFLIPHMIWDSPEQFELVNRIVKDCIHHQGYTIGVKITNIDSEISIIKNEIETETKVVKLTDNIIPKLHDGKYYRIPSFGRYEYMLKKTFDSIPIKGSNFIALYDSSKGNSMDYFVMKVNDRTVYISERNWQLECEKKAEKPKITRKPHELLIKEWDKRLKLIKDEIDKEITKIDNYVKIDLKNLTENIFVNPSKADIVLNKIEDIKIRLNQSKVKCDEIKDYYHSIEADISNSEED